MEVIECPICLEQDYNLKMIVLPCQHKLCEVCLNSCIDYLGQNEELKCPLCRCVFIHVPEEHILEKTSNLLFLVIMSSSMLMLTICYILSTIY